METVIVTSRNCTDEQLDAIATDVATDCLSSVASFPEDRKCCPVNHEYGPLNLPARHYILAHCGLPALGQ